MYLKSIKIDGFKSFADKTIFELKEGMTAIVGPNGSGKSNIVDAIKWVLGEQSVKELRGSNNMSDVIFSGTEKRSPLNKASVTLTFDNSDHYLNSEFKELEVKRTVYKSGENEYLINGSKVRLKDITNMFIDSGGGLDAFNIISQGSVTNIVNSKPLERRSIFESAAGVLKYKKRKEEALRKLDKTKENLLRVNLIIDELKTTVEPLKEQSELAKKYVSIEEELKGLEIALASKDITDINNKYKLLKSKNEEIFDSLEMFNNNLNNTEIEEIKTKSLKIDEEINSLNRQILELTEEISKLEAEKNINLERSKFKGDISESEKLIIDLKSEELNVKKDIEVIESTIKNNQDSLSKYTKEYNDLQNEFKSLEIKKNSLNQELIKCNKELGILENRKDIVEMNIESNERVPYAVKNILNNPRLTGIHGVVNNLIEVKDEYLLATDTILSSSGNFLVVDNEKCAKNAINYLKDNKLGRATFLPLNIIKSKYIDNLTLDRLNQINGFIGIMSDLISYDNLYTNIITNLMGNVIVVKDIDSMNLISKILEYKYRVVALDGSIVHAGGSISGGVNTKKNMFSKTELINIKNNINIVKDKIDKLNKNILDIENDYNILKDQINKISTSIIEVKNTITIDIKNKDNYQNKLNNIISEINGINDISNNNLDKVIEKLLEELSHLRKELELKEIDLNNKKDEKDNLNNRLKELEGELSKQNNEYRLLQAEYSKNEVEIGKMDVKLDNLLLLLNEEYNITYEYALNNYELSIEESLARNKVSTLRREMKSLGNVNLGSIKEYERLNTRYEFLTNQKNDLEVSMSSLLDIISEMDEIMITKFKESFNKISVEFTNVFKTIFRGGTGKLELTNPEDYLNTGIDITAVPPGKKLNNTQALSGGEKSLTAICLLFAILNVSTVPFIILDEVEAALDEVNVDMFGEYLSTKKKDSQFILITHKKRMMEYADTLYGITMQELGVSKIVGVKLEENI